MLVVMIRGAIQLALGMTLSFAVFAAVELPPELAHRVMKFYAEQGDDLELLVRKPAHKETSSTLLLEAKALHNVGLHQRATELFQKLSLMPNDEAADEARFSLGKSQFESGDCSAARKYLEPDFNRLAQSLVNQRTFFLASCYSRDRKFNQAAQELSGLQAGHWAAYGYYNLAMAYAENDTNSTRATLALRVAMAMASANDSEALELRDKIAVAAGYLAIQEEDFLKAQSFLKKVRIDSDSAAEALYLLGLSQSSQNDYRSAVQSWYRIRKYPLVRHGVPEAFMALPYAFEQQGYSGRSASAYLEAASVFEKEVRNITTIEKTIRKIGARDAMLRNSELDKLEWFLADSVATNTPKMAYLDSLLQHQEIYDRVDYLETLETLINLLERKQADLAVFQKMLQRRKQEYRVQLARFNPSRLDKQVEELSRQRDAVEQRIQSAISDKDFLAFATGDLQRQMARLNSAEDELTELPADKALESRQRLERLRGLVLWEAKEQYERNLRNLRSALADVDAGIAGYRDSRDRVLQDQGRGEAKFARMSERVTIAQNKVSDVLARAKSDQQRADQALADMMLAVLDQEKVRFTQRYEVAQQALTHLYEHLALLQYSTETEGAEQ